MDTDEARTEAERKAKGKARITLAAIKGGPTQGKGEGARQWREAKADAEERRAQRGAEEGNGTGEH
jgi:hypothetical protein